MSTDTATHRRALLRPDPATDHIRGPSTAAVTLIEYGDFECPSCRQAHSALKVMLPHFGERVRFVFRHFPLREVHPHAELAAEASEAAGAQGKFWEMHDMLFQHRLYSDEKHSLDCATRIGLDLARYHNEMRDQVYLQRVQEQLQAGHELGIRSTPAFFLDGTQVDVSFGMQRLHDAIETALARG